MRKRFVKGLALVMTLMLAIAMNGCALKAEADEVFSGELVDAQNNRLVVKSADKTMVFVTTSKTTYDLQDEEHICVGDEVEITFHKDNSIYLADNVKVTKHEDETMVFGGEVTELEKHYITIRSESLTAGFDYDEDTEIIGNLSKGDAVTVTYKGNISERPYAISIVVAEEKREEALKSFSGTASEVTKDSLFVSMDSADAARFKITEDTIVEGEDNKIKVGDEVEVVYTGTIGEDPVARTVKVKRNEKQKYYVMDGVITKVAKDSLSIMTQNKEYKFKIQNETRIQNKKYMVKDHKCTITYVGDIHKDPVAASVYCSKSMITKKEKKESKIKPSKTETKPTQTKTKATETQTKTEPTETKTDPTETQTEPTETKTEPTETQTEPTETQTEPTETETETEATEPETEATEPETEATEPPEPKPVIVKAKGTITKWNDPCEIKVEGGATIKLDIKDAKVSGGYVPEANDQVVIKYDKDSMKLTEIQLEYRPVDDSE